MKIENLNSESQVFGDVAQNTVGIDATNLDKVVMMLSSNLYSNPIDSFIREIVSNAWDSHIEKGNEEPVVVKLGRDGIERDKIYVTIRDYGVGISPERFDTVYRYMGASTKSDSNDYIGCFGLGKFSPLSVSDMVTITSYYEGVEYKYLMYKNGMGINIDLVSKKDTDEENGVAVTVKLPENRKYDMDRAIARQLMFFDSVFYINDLDPNIAGRFNGAKIKSYETFKVSSIQNQTHLLLGNVAYEYNISSLTNDSTLTQEEKNNVYSIQRAGIAIKFDIGELDVNPARETIYFNEKTLKAIHRKLKSVKKELFSLKKEEIEGVEEIDYFNLSSPESIYISEIGRHITIPTYTDTLEISKGVAVPYNSLYNLFRNFKSSYQIWSERFIGKDKIVKTTTNMYTYEFFKNVEIYEFDPESFTNLEKKYLKAKHRGAHLHSDWNAYVNSFSYKKKFMRLSRKKEDKAILKFLYVQATKRILDKVKKFDFKGMDENFMNSYKKAKPGERVFNVYERNAGQSKLTYDQLKSKSKQIVLVDNHEYLYVNDFNDIPKTDVLFIQTPKLLRERLLKNKDAITFKDFLETKKTEIIESYIKSSERANIGYDGLQSIAKLRNYFKIPKEDIEIIEYKGNTSTSLLRMLDVNIDKIKTTALREKYGKIFDITSAFNLNNKKGVEFMLDKLKELGYIKNNKLTI